MPELPDRPTFTDPAVIVAISCCWLERSKMSPSRVVCIEVIARHPEPCGFCDYPLAELLDYIHDFWDWSDRGEAGPTLAAWNRINRDGQRSRVLMAGQIAS